MNQLIKMFLMIMAATFAPIWIPFAVITVAPTSLFLAGLLSTVAVVITGILTIISSLLGIPLLLSIVAMMLAYLSYKATEELGAKAQRLTKRFLRELNITGRNWSLMNIDEMSSISKFATGQEGVGENYSRPLYEEESETETLVSRIEPSSVTHFPFPKASLPLLDLSDDVNEIEIFFNNVEELYAIICSLRRSARNRGQLHNRCRRNTVH